VLFFTKMRKHKQINLLHTNQGSQGFPRIPYWIRPPKTGQEPYTGIARTKLFELAKLGHIRSTSLREPGQRKGTRLFHLGSILEFIEQSEKQFSRKEAA
jgi:hypothetical protein